MTPLSFALDIGHCCKVVIYSSDHEQIRSQVNRGLCSIERIFIAAVGYLMLGALRDRMDMLKFRMLVCLSSLIPENCPALAIYVVVQGVMQIKDYSRSQEIGTKVLFYYGIFNIICSVGLDVLYIKYIEENLWGQSHRDHPPLMSWTVFQAHDWAVDRIVHLITMVRWRSLNRG